MQYLSVLKKGTFLIAASLLLFSACKKTNSNPLTDADDNGGYASDISKIEWVNNDVISLADAAGDFYNGVYMRVTNTFGECATVATDTFDNPHVLTIRFPSTPCTCLDGKTRSGAIVITYTGDYSDSNKLHTITFNNYYLNGQQVTGNIKVTRIDTTVIGDWYYKESVNDTLITTPNTFIIWQGALVRKWLAGYSTGDRSDNVYSISGSALLTRPNGHVFGCQIGTPLQVAQNCDFIESGVINVTNPQNGLRILNYALGGGGCDDQAQLNIDTHVYQLQLTQ